MYAEAEMLHKQIREQDQMIAIASDGVWEFLTNQSVADMILKFTDPLDACRAVVAESYRLWLQYEVRTDDPDRLAPSCWRGPRPADDVLMVC